jgi:hypothetical protein
METFSIPLFKNAFVGLPIGVGYSASDNVQNSALSEHCESVSSLDPKNEPGYTSDSDRETHVRRNNHIPIQGGVR